MKGVLRASWAVLEVSWVVLEASWAVLKASWAFVEAITVSERSLADQWRGPFRISRATGRGLGEGNRTTFSEKVFSMSSDTPWADGPTNLFNVY